MTAYDWLDTRLGSTVRQERVDRRGMKYAWPGGLGEHRQADLLFVDPWADPDDTGPVVACEGAKAASAVQAAGIQAVGLVSASTIPSKHVLGRLAGRVVILWPDADPAGRALMGRVGKRLEALGVEVRPVRWEDAPAHADAADLPPDRIREIVEEALQGVRLLFGRGERSPEGDVDVQPPAGSDHDGVATIPAVGIDAADLLGLELAPLRWIVPDLLPEGTTIIAAPPKVGKSCLVYQVGVEVAIGGALLGRRVEPGSVLYLALEDGRRRGQDRLRANLAGRTMPRGRLEVRWSARQIGKGLEDDVARWLDDHPDARVVAIDTLGKVRPRSDGRRNAYEVDVQDLARLQDLFRDRSVALVIVHHARKEGSDDFLQSVSGTYGITGSADTIVVVRRKRLESFGTILVTGRDVADAEIPVRFDGMTWHQAPESLPEASFERLEVYRAIEENGPIFPAAIAAQTGLERTSVQHMVAKLVESGAVARTTKGYVAPSASRAHAYALSPHHSGHSGSDESEQGHPRTNGASVGARMAELFEVDVDLDEETRSKLDAAVPAVAYPPAKSRLVS